MLSGRSGVLPQGLPLEEPPWLHTVETRMVRGCAGFCVFMVFGKTCSISYHKVPIVEVF